MFIYRVGVIVMRRSTVLDHTFYIIVLKNRLQCFISAALDDSWYGALLQLLIQP